MKRIGFCVCGSFCTLKATLAAIDDLISKGFDITPIFSFNVKNLDTRFFRADDFRQAVEEKTGKKIICTLQDAEPIAKANLDAVIVLPCTGNTLAKIANGITDTPVTLAVKAELRNNRPVVIALSSNDALGANAKNVFFVPLRQDAPSEKPNSMVADFSLTAETLNAAIDGGKQYQPRYV